MVNDELGSGYCYGPKKPDGTRAIFQKLPGAAAILGLRPFLPAFHLDARNDMLQVYACRYLIDILPAGT